MEKIDKKDNTELFKEIFNKWGTYQSLEKDAMIVDYFLKQLNKSDKFIRQKTLVNHFKDDMSPKTCRVHIYRLLDKMILFEHPDFRGAYQIDPEYAKALWNTCDQLIGAVMSSEICNLARNRWKPSYSPY